ncbi:MAG: flippase [Candidatus Blackburnbacteria bacterium]|nr:flippase [Candidatus Blackburnbacteria bacterium]
MDIGRLIFKNASFQVIGKVITIFSSLLLTWFLRDRLGNEGYGVYVFVTAFVLFFGNIADWGTNLIVVREASRVNQENQNTIFTSSISFRLLLSFIAVILVNIFIRANLEWQPFVLPATIASFVLLALSLKNSLAIILQTIMRFGLLTMMEVLLSISFLLLSVAFLINNFNVHYVMLAWVVATAISAFLGFWFTRQHLKRFSFDWNVSKKIIKEALPTGTLLIVFSIYNRIDILILQHFWGTDSVGVYGLSYKIYETLITGAAFIVSAAYPLLSSLKHTEDVRHVYQKTFNILAATCLVLFLVTFILAPSIKLLWGESSLASVLPLRILSVALIFSYLNHLTGYSLIALGKQKISLLIGVFALLLNLSLNFLLIPHYSYQAASVMTVVTEGFVFVCSSVALYQLTDLRPSFLSFPKTIYSLLFARRKNGK